MAFQRLILTNFPDYPTNPSTQVTVPESSANGYVISPISIEDTNISATYTLYMTDGASGRFNLLLNNGIYSLIVRDTNKIDYETNNSHAVQIRATDQTGTVTMVSITINVLNQATLTSGINSITTKASAKNNPTDVTINGNNFIEGGQPIVVVNGNAVNIVSATNNEIKFRLLTDYADLFVYEIKVLNGYEQSLL